MVPRALFFLKAASGWPANGEGQREPPGSKSAAREQKGWTGTWETQLFPPRSRLGKPVKNPGSAQMRPTAQGAKDGRGWYRGGERQAQRRGTSNRESERLVVPTKRANSPKRSQWREGLRAHRESVGLPCVRGARARGSGEGSRGAAIASWGRRRRRTSSGGCRASPPAGTGASSTPNDLVRAVYTLCATSAA